MKIAVLFHLGDRGSDPSRYIVHHLAGFWREDGHEVVYLFGPDEDVEADIAFVHVNLSVVPTSYLDLAARYPIAINARIADIRKSVTSKNLLTQGDPYIGPVIVKSDLNFAGEPERVMARGALEKRSELLRRVRGRIPHRGPFGSWKDYQLYDSLADVPRRWFQTSGAVIEKFMPEYADGLYHVRMLQVLGDRWGCIRAAAPEPIFKAHMSVSVEQIEPHPEAFAWREALGMDYGKLDYVVHNGEAVLLDANKTVGASRHMSDDALRVARRHQAEGLYSYF